jgi:hypothetical protein
LWQNLEDMCQANVITRRVVRLSRRSFNHRIEVASPNGYPKERLAKLNHELNNLYEMIYEEWATITEDDYKVFGGQLEILLQTIKNLYDTCKKQPREMDLKDETQKLGMNYSALYELNSDIVNFRIKLPQNEEMRQVLNQLAEMDNSNATNRA